MGTREPVAPEVWRLRARTATLGDAFERPRSQTGMECVEMYCLWADSGHSGHAGGVFDGNSGIRQICHV